VSGLLLFMNDVYHPKHYTEHPSGVECIQIAEAFNYNLGNVIKYVWRAGLKTKDPLQDLQKAARYIEFEIVRLQRERGQ
jgi:hypothetical protein